MIKVAVLVVCVVACNKDKPAGAHDCADVLDKTVDHLIKQGMTEGATETAGKMTPEVKAEVDRMAKEMNRMGGPIKAALVKACTDDKWPADVLDCYAKADTSAAGDACEAKLSPEQRRHADTAVTEAMEKAAPAASPECKRYADLEIQCGSATETDRPVIVDFCTKARGGAKEATYQLIALESTCAATAKDCAAYKACVDDKKATTNPD
jgi:hypothetical protein